LKIPVGEAEIVLVTEMDQTLAICLMMDRVHV
jgi:hypothetical protein